MKVIEETATCRVKTLPTRLRRFTRIHVRPPPPSVPRQSTVEIEKWHLHTVLLVQSNVCTASAQTSHRQPRSILGAGRPAGCTHTHH